MASFWDRLIALGFKSYSDYLQGDHWRDFKRRYRNSKRPRRCQVCSKTPVQLHHHTYQRLGAESFDDVSPLCREHHIAVHEALKQQKWPVENTYKVVASLKSKMPATIPPIIGRKQRAKERAKQERQERLDECKTLIAEGFWSSGIQKGWVPSFRDKNLFRYARLLRRAKRRGKAPPSYQFKPGLRDLATVVFDRMKPTKEPPVPTPDLADQHTVHRLIAAGFRLPK